MARLHPARPHDKWWKDKNFTGKLVRLALPISLQSLMLAVVAAADALMLGRLEQNSMSAVSLATQVQFVQNMLLSSAVSAFTILGAQYWGKREYRALHRLFGMTVRFCGAASVVWCAACVLAPRPLMLLFTNEPVLLEIGVDYLRIAGWSYLLTGFSQCWQALLKVTETPRAAATVSIGTVLLNILLNAVFIFGLGPAPAMGARGAALATLISRIVEMIWSVAYTFGKGYFHPDLRQLLVRDAVLAASFRKCLLPLLGASLAWGIGYTSYTAFMGHLGTDAAAAASVAAVVRDLLCCLCNGIAAGGGILIGNELGAGNLEKGRLAGDRIAKIAFICGFGSTAIMLAFTPVLLSFVQLTDMAQKILLQLMIVMSFYMIGRAVNTILINGIFAAGGDTMFDLYSLAVTMWGIAVPLAALGTFVLGWPAAVVYACTCLDEVGKIPWVMLHYRKYKWVKDLTVHREQPENSQ